MRPDRKQLVADCLEALGYLPAEQAGEALGALTEPQLLSVRVQNASLNVEELDAVLRRVKPQGGL